MTAVWRATTGGFFALAGLVLWRMAHMIPGPDQISTGLAGRWAAIALAVGGLLLAFRRRLTLVWLLLGVVWLVADAFLDPRTVVAIVTGVALVVGGLLLVVPASTRDSRAGAPAWPRLVYAGTLVGIRPDVIVSASQDVFDQVWLALALATAMLVLATLLAAEAGPRPSPVARSTRANVVFAVLALHTGAVVLRFAAADDFVPDFAVDALHSLLVTPLILGTLVALTGVLAPDGRGARTFAGLLAVGPLVVAPFAGNAASAALRRLEASLGDPAPMAWMVVTSTLVTGVLLGLIVLVAARLLWRERLIEPEPARADRSEQQATAAAVDGAGGGSLGAGAGDWRRWAGTLLTGLGILAWLAVVALVQPRLGAGSTAPGGGVPPADADQLAALAVLALDARWAGMVAAVGGLRLLGGRPGFGVVAVVGGWVAADMVLLTTGMAPWVAVAVAAAVLAGAVAVAVRRRDPGSATPAWGYVYSGAAAGVAVALLAGVEPWMGRYLAAWTLPAVAGLAVLLVAACVANALALASAQFQRRRRSGVSRQFGTGGWVGEEGTEFVGDASASSVDGMPGISSGRLVAALTVGAVGAASVVAIGTAARASGPTAVWLASAVVLGGVVAAGAGVAGLGPRPGWAVPGTFVLAVVVAVWTFLGADRIAALIRHVVTLLGWVPPVGAALPAVGAGLATGSAVAVLVLLPHALSTPDTAPASQPTPPPSAAPAARKAPAPVAIPGVPEILEWPPRRASRAGQEGFASE